MAGSLAHIVGQGGEFNMETIENLGDAYEALEECYAIIYVLADGSSDKVSNVCKQLGYVDPWDKQRYGDDPMPGPMIISNET